MIADRVHGSVLVRGGRHYPTAESRSRSDRSSTLPYKKRKQLSCVAVIPRDASRPSQSLNP